MIRQNRTSVELMDRFRGISPASPTHSDTQGAPNGTCAASTSQAPTGPQMPSTTQSTSQPPTTQMPAQPPTAQPSSSLCTEEQEVAPEKAEGDGDWPPSMDASFDELYTVLFPPLGTLLAPLPRTYSLDDLPVAEIRAKVPPNLVCHFLTATSRIFHFPWFSASRIYFIFLGFLAPFASFHHFLALFLPLQFISLS